MLQLAITEEKDFLAAPYPIKNIYWKNIEVALENGLIKNLEDFDKYSGKHSIFFLDYDENISKTIPQKADVASTGFMLISKKVFKKYEEVYKEREYFDYNDTRRFSFFWCGVDQETKKYLSEDYMFCLEARRIGFDIWLCPWIDLDHTGVYVFKGSYSFFLELLKKDTSHKLF